MTKGAERDSESAVLMSCMGMLGVPCLFVYYRMSCDIQKQSFQQDLSLNLLQRFAAALFGILLSILLILGALFVWGMEVVSVPAFQMLLASVYTVMHPLSRVSLLTLFAYLVTAEEAKGSSMVGCGMKFGIFMAIESFMGSLFAWHWFLEIFQLNLVLSLVAALLAVSTGALFRSQHSKVKNGSLYNNQIEIVNFGAFKNEK